MNLRTLALCAAVAASFAFGSVQAKEPVEPQPATPLTYVNPSYHKITPDVAKKMMESEKVVILDVRTPEEVKADGYIKGSVNVPLDQLRPGVKLEAAPDLNQKILVHCKSGVRAEKASKILVETGYKNVYNFYGTLQWPYELTK